MSEKFSLKWQDFLNKKKDLEDEDEMDDLDLVKEALFKLVNASNDDVKEFTEDENCDEKKTKVGRSNLWLQRQKTKVGKWKWKKWQVIQCGSFDSIEDLDRKICEMMERESDGRYRCLTCGKFTKNRGHMQEHIEVHIEGLNFPCPQCDKSFRGRGGLRKHIRNLHEAHKKSAWSGTITPPQSYDHLSLEERRSLLTSACGVTLSNNKICLRPTRCSAHTDHQRREVRLKWLGGRGSSAGDLEELDLDSDGDTVALRESLSQLSNASSPAESVVSTSSNPGSLVAHSSRHSSHSSRHKGKRGKKGRPGSKNGSSRGSTPPMEH